MTDADYGAILEIDDQNTLYEKENKMPRPRECRKCKHKFHRSDNCPQCGTHWNKTQNGKPRKPKLTELDWSAFDINSTKYEADVRDDVVLKMVEFQDTIMSAFDSNGCYRLIAVFDSGLEFDTIFPESPVLSSTAIGYVNETIVTKAKSFMPEGWKSADGPTNQTPYDVIYECDEYTIVVNLKSVLSGDTKAPTQSGVCAVGPFVKTMYDRLQKKPTYYFTFSLLYSIEGNGIDVCESSYYCLDNYLADLMFRTDGREWNGSNGHYSHRITINDKVEYADDVLPAYETLVKNLLFFKTYSREDSQMLKEMNNEYNKEQRHKMSEVAA